MSVELLNATFAHGKVDKEKEGRKEITENVTSDTHTYSYINVQRERKEKGERERVINLKYQLIMKCPTHALAY